MTAFTVDENYLHLQLPDASGTLVEVATFPRTPTGLSRALAVLVSLPKVPEPPRKLPPQKGRAGQFNEAQRAAAKAVLRRVGLIG